MADTPAYFDQRLANESAAVDQCLKLGGVILKPPAHRAGFVRQPGPAEEGSPPCTETSPE